MSFDSDSTSPIVGIDLGTTRSVIADLDDLGRPTTITNAEGDLTTPSAVFFDDDGLLIGKEAIKAMPLHSDRIAQFVKRDTANTEFSISVNGAEYSAELIQSFILGKLRSDAEQLRGYSIDKAVITVPASFNEPKRRATIESGMMAGLDVKAIINEPTAAALAFSVGARMHEVNRRGKGNSETMLVYDLGGGTFDASLLRMEPGSIDVIGVDGISQLGGLDWDKCLANWISEQLGTQYGLSTADLDHFEATLLREAEEVKHTLSATNATKFRKQFSDLVIDVPVTRERFEDVTAHLLDRTRFTVSKLLEDNRITWTEVDRILLVGGSVRMPQVSQMLEKVSGKSVDRSVSPDQAVAHGAAIYAGQIAREAAGGQGAGGAIRVSDVNAHSLGVLGVEVSTGRRRGYMMIPRNSRLPAQTVARFETRHANQRSVVVRIIEGGDLQGRHATQIGRFVVHGLPGGLPAGWPIDVVMKYDRDGIIGAEATVVRTGKQARIRIDRVCGLAFDQKLEWRPATNNVQAAITGEELSEEASDATNNQLWRLRDSYSRYRRRLIEKLEGLKTNWIQAIRRRFPFLFDDDR